MAESIKRRPGEVRKSGTAAPGRPSAIGRAGKSTGGCSRKSRAGPGSRSKGNCRRAARIGHSAQRRARRCRRPRAKGQGVRHACLPEPLSFESLVYTRRMLLRLLLCFLFVLECRSISLRKKVEKNASNLSHRTKNHASLIFSFLFISFSVFTPLLSIPSSSKLLRPWQASKPPLTGCGKSETAHRHAPTRRNSF